MTLKIMKIMALIVLSIWLGFSHSNYHQSTSTMAQATDLHSVSTLPTYNLISLLSRTDENKLAEMAFLAQQQQETLEFMVWPEERRKVLLQSILITQQQINQQPTNALHWQRLLSLQYEYNAESEQLSWIIDKVYSSVGWNKQSLIWLSRYCVPFAFNKKRPPSACSQVIKNLPNQDQEKALARQIGISLEDLDVVLSRFN